jgi:hypothetical protein
VLTSTRKVVQGQFTYFVPAGQVIRLATIPETMVFNAGVDTKIIDAGAHKLGDHVDV